jgi:tRNA dimethylallyltransferase
MEKTRLIVVAGPTASGKTTLAIELAKRLDGEIVSADSMQIYKYMDIGSAKPTAEEQAEIPHHLIDFLEPDAEWSVANYTEAAHKTIAEIAARKKMPVMVGGTGLYINSVVNDVSFGEIDTDYQIREQLQEIADNEGGEKLIEMLREFDPDAAKTLHPNNVRRIIRAIEFYRVTGTPISKHQEMTRQVETRYNPTMFLIDWDREELYERINLRVDLMIKDGLLDEVKRLMDMGYTKDLNSMKGIGYKELIDYFNGEYSLDEAINLIKQSSRRYAKRQLTWFRRDERIHWLDAHGNPVEEAMKILQMQDNHT